MKCVKFPTLHEVIKEISWNIQENEVLENDDTQRFYTAELNSKTK